MNTPPAVVLDTNVVLDWLVFRNPACSSFVAAIESGHLHWIASKPMRDELCHVLARGLAAAHAVDTPLLWQSWDRHARMLTPSAPQGPASRLRCTDPDDQKFIDLALAHGQWLLSRDRAVLKLARRALTLGVRFSLPEGWSPV